MTLPILASIGLALAALTALFLGVATGFYTAKVPSGPDSMSLATPMIALVALWIVTLIAAWLCVAHGSLDWISSRPLVPFATATLGVLGLGLASGGAFIVWSQSGSAWGIPIANVGTVLLPLATQALLMACAWTDPAALRAGPWPRVALFALAPCASVGLALGGWMLVERQRKTARLVAERLARDEAIASGRGSGTPRLDALAASASFARIVVLLPEDDAAVSRAIVDRATLAPDLARALDAALRSSDSALRIGAAEYVRRVTTADPGCADALAVAIRASADDIRRVGMMSGLEGEDFRRWTEALVGAARRLPEPPLAAAVAALRETIAATSDEPERSQALQVIDAR